ncbi:MAG: BamA/TamA family outer membrane protein, partial [Bacteroidota bacterium]
SVIRRFRFSGNDHVRNRTLRTLIRSRTNREMLGIPGLTPWYTIHQLTGGRFGESPSLLDRAVLQNDRERIRLYYNNLGYFDTTVRTSIVEFASDRVEVTFFIDEGVQSTIETIRYEGVPDFEEERIRERFYEQSLLSGESIDDSTFQVQRSYNAQLLRDEQTRVIEFLRNNSFASVQRDSVRALIRPDPENPEELDLLFRIHSGESYRFGDVYIRLAGPDADPTYDDTLTVTELSLSETDHAVHLYKDSQSQTKFSLLSDQIRFRPGDPFDHSLYLQSVNEFQNLGMVTIQGFGLSEDGSIQDYDTTEIPVYMDLQTLPRHSIRTEVFGMRRYGFGTGLGVNYSNNNLFGRAENLSLGLHSNVELVTDREFSDSFTLFNTYQMSADYSVPRLNFPFTRLDKHPLFTSGRTRYQLSYGQSNQPLFDINSDLRFNLRYEVSHGGTLTSYLDLLEMDIVDADPSPEYLRALRNQFRRNPDEPDDVVESRFEYQRILEDFRPQFSSIIRYTLRDHDTNLIKRDRGYFNEYSLSVGGNVAYLMDQFMFSPGSLEGTLPSPLGLSSNALGYSQFFKISADIRRYIPLGPETVVAWRLFGGYAHPYNKSRTIPLNRRFFAGGSNDIRGWGPFRLGPGAISPEELPVSGGEIKLAAFAEWRQLMFDNLLNSDWYLALYTDSGNVWYGSRHDITGDQGEAILEDGQFFFDSFYRQIAVGSGFGLRLDWDFIVARVDFTFRTHDPVHGWFDSRKAYFSFGIGHSF